MTQDHEICQQSSNDIFQDIGMGYIHYDQERYHEAFTIFHRYACQNHATADYGLGLLYYYGKGVDKDFAKSTGLFYRGCRAGA